jgi:hypothetical protein
MTSVYFTFQAIRDLRGTFADRIGEPDECTSALGHVTVAFSWLEQSLEHNIAELAQASPLIAPALTAELSYKTKVSVLSSLVRVSPPLRAFNVGSQDALEVWTDITKMLSSCEELRNKLLHSHWQLSIGRETMLRTKTIAKTAHGVRAISEELTSDYLLDVYDYFLNVDWVLNEFFLEPA